MPKWLKNTVFYEIYPQSFCDSNGDGIGDFNGIIEKLDYIKGLGCNAIWLNPCFDSPFMDAGYDVRDYKLAAPRYGTNEDLCRLFKAAHEKELKVVLDLVPGHTSEEHDWFKKSALPEKNEYSNRFVWTNSVWDSPQEYRFISGRSDRDGNYMINFFSTQPALNYGFNKITHDWQLHYTHPDCVATREAMKDVMRFWLDRGCDGFRVDMAFSLVKNDEDKSATSEIWREVRQMLDENYPNAAFIAEWSEPELSLNCGFHADFLLNREGSGYESLFRRSDKKIGKQLSFFSKEGSGDIRLFLDEYLRYYNSSCGKGYISIVTCNHDTTRLSPILSESELKLAYAFIFTMPGVPFLYYGDEIGMRFLSGLTSKEGGYSRTGSRTPMQWNGEKNLGFSSADADRLYLPIDKSTDAPTVENQSGRASSLLNTVKALLKLRNENEDLQADGEFEVLYAKSGEYPFIYRRGALIVGVNPSQNTVSAPVSASGKPLFAIGNEPQISDGTITMAPQSFFVLHR